MNAGRPAQRSATKRLSAHAFLSLTVGHLSVASSSPSSPAFSSPPGLRQSRAACLSMQGGAASARPKVVVISGPTAVGKSALAEAIAKSFPGGAELISADSVQVYRGMDIGSAKPTPRERASVQYHLIDVADPTGSLMCYISNTPCFDSVVHLLRVCICLRAQLEIASRQ